MDNKNKQRVSVCIDKNLVYKSADTTLDIYSHVTDEMQKKAAASIDRKIARKE